MASIKDENNWGGMAPSKKPLTTPKVTLPAAKKKTSTAKKSPLASLITTPWNTGGVTSGYSLGMNMAPISLPKKTITGTGQGASVLGNYIAKSGVGATSKQKVPLATPKPTGLAGSIASKTNYMTPDQLYVDPTPAYQPVLDFLKAQEKAARERYATNSANIKNIFGSLTGLTAEDSARITKQFTDSLAASKADLAARTAEARTGAAAGVEQAIATGAERGGGPAMAINPVQTAAEEGIARSNEYATTWQALQAANEQQAQADISARGAGYGQQEVAAIQQLAQNLEDKLLAIGGNTAQVKSDIAQAKYGQQVDIQQVKFQLSEQAKQAAAQAAAAASAKPSYSKDIFGLKKRMKDAGVDFETIAGEVSASYDAAYKKLNTINGVPRTTTAVKPSAAEVKAAWNKKYGNKKNVAYAQSYIDLQF